MAKMKQIVECVPNFSEGRDEVDDEASDNDGAAQGAE